MTIDQGRTRRLWLKKEASYGVEESLAATDAMLYVSPFNITHAPNNKVDAPEKNPSPGRFRRFKRKPTTSGEVSFDIQPSGTLNTLSDNDPIFECALGARTNVTLATTVASSPTTTGCTVASAGALAIGDAVLLEVTGQPQPLFIRVLTNVAGNVLTWSPALPAAQTVGDDVKGTTTYKLATGLGGSLTALRALPSGKKEALTGWSLDTINFALDANAEIRVTAGGPAKTRLGTSGSQAAPGSSTFLASVNPPSGITDGYLMVDATTYLMKSMGVNIVNAVALRNTEYGVLLSTEANRDGVRTVDVTLDAWSETEATLKDKAEAGTAVSVLCQTGRTQGNIVGLWLPKVEFEYPSEDDPDGQITWAFSGAALETTQGANDEFKLILA